jgi:hypothetical protein
MILKDQAVKNQLNPKFSLIFCCQEQRKQGCINSLEFRAVISLAWLRTKFNVTNPSRELESSGEGGAVGAFAILIPHFSGEKRRQSKEKCHFR